MALIERIHRWIDPEHHIPFKAWLKIIALGLLSGMLFLASILLALVKDRSVSGSVKMKELSIWPRLLGSQIDSLHMQIDLYDTNLREYVINNDTGCLSRVFYYRKAFVATRAKMDKIISIHENHILVQKIVALSDSAFASGARAIDFLKQGNRAAAEAAFDRYESYDLRFGLLVLTGEIFRNKGVRLYRYIEEDGKKATITYHKLFLPLIFLSGTLFFLWVSSLFISIRQIMQDRRTFENLSKEGKRNSDLIQSILNMAPIGFHTYHKSGLLMEMNQTQLDWLGYTRDEMVGKPLDLSKIIHEDSDQLFSEFFPRLIQDGYIANVELNMIGKDGEIFPVLINSKAIFDEDGSFSYCITTVLNFSERKKLENQLLDASREAQNSNNLKQFFISNMSHEIRTPLNSIIGFSNLLTRSELPPHLKEYVQHIRTSGHALLNIVNDILDFEKIRSGVLQIENIAFNLSELLFSVISMMQPAASEKLLSLYLGIDAEVPRYLLGDPHRLTQILSNLLSNAVKFTEAGHVTLRVSAVSFDTSQEWVRIRFSIEDSGIGIPDAEHKRIFERFTQANADTTRKYGGTGLGLTLVKMLAELQHGEVKLTSTTNQGSIFTVEIPYRWTQQPPDETVPSNAEVLPDLSGFGILLAEDDPVNRRIASIYLSELGVSVTLAPNGLEAIRLLRESPSNYDLIFMDIRMPEMDGYSATRIIRDELGVTEIPIIAMTAQVLPNELENVTFSGMNDYLTKPINYKDLVNLLLKYLKPASEKAGDIDC